MCCESYSPLLLSVSAKAPTWFCLSVSVEKGYREKKEMTDNPILSNFGKALKSVTLREWRVRFFAYSKEDVTLS